MKKKSDTKRFLAFCRKYNKYFFISLLFSVITAVAHSSYPAIIESFLNNKDLKHVNFLVGLIFVLVIVRGITYFLYTFFINKMANLVIYDFKMAAFKHMHLLSMKYFENNKPGDIISRFINDVIHIQNGMYQVGKIIKDIVKFLALLCYIFYLSWKLALVTFIIIPFVGTVASVISKKIKRASRAVLQNVGSLSSVLSESIRAIRIVKSFNLQEKEVDRFNKKNHENYLLNMKIVKINSLTLPALEFINTISIAVVIWYGGYQIYTGAMKTSELMAFLLALSMLMIPIKAITNANNEMQKAKAAIRRIYELLDESIDVNDDEASTELVDINGQINFRDVYFSYYKNEDYALKNINVEIKPGEKIALVGSSGSGKTSFINLILRFYDVTKGEIQIDDTNIKNITLNNLRDLISYVTQESILFPTTIKKNMLIAKDDASDSEIENALSKANILEFINGLEKKIDTHIGEQSSKLSGGQKQRICIARSILKNRKLFLLDEATAALDSESENRIMSNLYEYLKEKTVITIAHRLSTIINSDRIFVFDQGEIKEIGSHNELLQRENSIYKNLYEEYKKNEN